MLRTLRRRLSAPLPLLTVRLSLAIDLPDKDINRLIKSRRPPRTTHFRPTKCCRPTLQRQHHSKCDQLTPQQDSLPPCSHRGPSHGEALPRASVCPRSRVAPRVLQRRLCRSSTSRRGHLSAAGTRRQGTTRAWRAGEWRRRLPLAPRLRHHP